MDIVISAMLAAGFAAAAGGASVPAHGMQDSSTVAASEPAERVLAVSGPIGPDFARDLRRFLERRPDTTVIAIRGPGGLRHQALLAAEVVNARGITVRIDGHCASACALLWASARSREMTPASRLGLHRSRIDATLPLPAALVRAIESRNDRRTDDALRGAGFPPRLIDLGNRTPPTTMAWFAAAELAREGVAFRVERAAVPHLDSIATVPSAP